MSTIMQVVMITVVVIVTAAVAYADQGTATFYTPPYLPSACNGNKDDGVMIAAASAAIWDDKGACGRTYQVTCTGATNEGDHQPCTGQSVAVKIVDFCPNCGGTIDLSQEAFAIIANPDAGKIDIHFDEV